MTKVSENKKVVAVTTATVFGVTAYGLWLLAAGVPDPSLPMRIVFGVLMLVHVVFVFAVLSDAWSAAGRVVSSGVVVHAHLDDGTSGRELEN